MQKATSIMYTIGNVLNIIGIVFAILMVVLAAIGLSNPTEIYQKMVEEGTDVESVEALKALFVTLIVFMVIEIIIQLIILSVVRKAKRANNNAESSVGIHVAVLVLSILCGGLFYLLGSIFGIITANQVANKQ